MGWKAPKWLLDCGDTKYTPYSDKEVESFATEVRSRADGAVQECAFKAFSSTGQPIYTAMEGSLSICTAKTTRKSPFRRGAAERPFCADN